MIEFLDVYARNIGEWLPRLLAASLVTLQLTVVSYIIGALTGLLLAVARLAPFRPLRLLSAWYVEVVRGIPLLVVLFIVYFGLPSAGIVLDSVTAAYIAFGLYVGAYLAEVFRAGIQSIHPSQREAALSIGLTPLTAFGTVILPQAFVAILPPLINTLVGLLKETSLAAIIAVPELTLRARSIATLEFRSMHLYLLAALIYLMMSYVFASGGRRLEARLRHV